MNGGEMPSIKRDFGELYYHVRGSGEPAILLLHDFFGTHQSWAPVQAELARYAQTIAPDLRGHGRSVAYEGKMSIRAMAGDVLSVLDELEIKQAHIVGCSHGAVIALHLARTAPDRVSSIAVTSIPDITNPDVLEYGNTFVNDVFPRLETRLDQLHGLGNDGYARERLLSVFAASLQELPEDHRDAVDRAAEVTCSTLVLSGDSDPVMSPERAVQLMRRLPRGNLAVIPQTGHLAHQEAPMMYASAVLDHLWRTGTS